MLPPHAGSTIYDNDSARALFCMFAVYAVLSRALYVQSSGIV